jgi:hypothetical protein
LIIIFVLLKIKPKEGEMKKAFIIALLAVGAWSFFISASHAYYLDQTVVCTGVDSDNMPIGITEKRWESGSDPYFYVNVKDIGVDHKFKYVVARNGKHLMSYQEEEWRDVGSRPWENSSFYGHIPDIPMGDYVVTFYMDTGNGFEELARLHVEVGSEEDQENNYSFDRAVLCEGVDDFYKPINPTSRQIWDVGSDLCFYVNITDVGVDHKFKYRFSRTNQHYQFSVFHEEEEWRDVYNWPWKNSYFFGCTKNVAEGDHIIVIYLDTGEGFEELASLEFTVEEVEEQSKNIVSVINLLLLSE